MSSKKNNGFFRRSLFLSKKAHPFCRVNFLNPFRKKKLQNSHSPYRFANVQWLVRKTTKHIPYKCFWKKVMNFIEFHQIKFLEKQIHTNKQRQISIRGAAVVFLLRALDPPPWQCLLPRAFLLAARMIPVEASVAAAEKLGGTQPPGPS